MVVSRLAGENGELKFLPGQPKLLTGAALKDYQITGVKVSSISSLFLTGSVTDPLDCFCSGSVRFGVPGGGQPTPEPLSARLTV